MMIPGLLFEASGGHKAWGYVCIIYNYYQITRKKKEIR